MKNKYKKIIIIILSLLLVCGCGIFVFVSWNHYQKEKVAMKENAIAEITEVFHDQGDIYMEPIAPKTSEEVTIRLRCKKYNVTKAQIQVTLDKGNTWECIEMVYDKKDETGYYDLWKGTIPAQSEPYFYRFALGNDAQNSTIYYGTEGLKSNQVDTDEMFYVIPGFDTPKWSQGALWYYVHVGQFFNGDTSNDISREYLLKDNTYGTDYASMVRGTGDLAGLKEKLDYIQELGVTAMEIGPYFSASESVGFGTDNMEAVETAFGTEEELKELISEMHDRDMKVITDMILSYVGRYSKYYDINNLFPTDGGYESKDSKYYPMFRFPKWADNTTEMWGSIALDYSNEEAKNLIYRNKDSLLLRYLNEPYGLDGYRFDAEDSVNNLGFEYDAEELFLDMRKEMKNLSEDKLMLNESGSEEINEHNIMFDSSWQKNGYFAMKNWLDGSSTGSDLFRTFQENLINTTRPRALSSYNFLGSHDVIRIFDDTEAQKDDIRALLLFQMTYLGSPVIYYGDEVGATNGLYDYQKASMFNWDESQWDYRILNLTKSLGKLRQEYSCLKTGVVCHGEVDDKELFLSFGRFDDSGAVITLCNKQNKVLEKEINVSRYNIRDGAKLTDYLTGDVYKVKDGKITVKVVPGGSILVTGQDVSPYLEQFEIMDMGKELVVSQTDRASYEVKAKGKLDSAKDSIGFLATDVYNNVRLSSDVTTENKGKAVLMLRNTEQKDSAFYAATLSGTKLTISARAADGAKVQELTNLNIPKEAQICVERGRDNQFVAYYKAAEADEWKLVEKSKITVKMNENILAGMTVLSGKVVFSNVCIEQGSAQISEDFEGEVLGSMFGNDKKNAELSGGKLVLNATKELAYVETIAHPTDWTMKTEIAALEVVNKEDAGICGVMSMANEEDYVIAGRAVLEGKSQLIIGKINHGKLQLMGATDDTAVDKNITIQLQRVGSYYTAVATYDNETWFQIGERIYCNYTGMYAGIFSWNAVGQFEYACFGDSIQDGQSYNTPITLGELDTDWSKYFWTLEADKMVWLGNEDSWEDIGAGYEQKSVEGVSLLFCENKLFEDVKAEVSVNITDGTGTAGIFLAKQSATKDLNDCYRIALDKDKKLSVIKNGKEVESCKLDMKENTIRLIALLQNGYLHVFAGENAKLVLSVQDTTYGAGYAGYYTENTSASFVNYDITVLDATWLTQQTVMGNKDRIEMISAETLVTMEGVGLTEGIVTFYADTALEKDQNATFGVLLGNSVGQKDLYGGALLTYNYTTGILEVTEAGASLGKVSVAQPETMPNISVMVVFRKGVYDIYVNQSKEAVLTVKTQTTNGGGVSFYTKTKTTNFYNMKATDITGVSDIEALNIVKEWRNGNTTLEISGKRYVDDFSNYLGWNHNFYKLKTNTSDWQIEDGVLKANSLARNWTIATMTSGIYKDVDVSLKVRFIEQLEASGIFTLSIGKQEAYAGYSDTGISFSLRGAKTVSAYDYNSKKALDGWSNVKVNDLGEWMEMRIKSVNGIVTFYLDGRELWSGRVPGAQAGYIALQADYLNLEIDDLKVIPLSK